ncbi:MAG: ABC transporter substrate-binding protein [Solirubrobacterales bacterium]
MLRRCQGLALAALIATSLAAAPAAAEDRAEVVRIPFPQEDGSLTPYTFEVGYPLVTLIYDTVMWRDAEGVPRPWLAESVTRSADGRRITIRLRPGIRWQDGRPLTASDVQFTFEFVAAHPHPRLSQELEDIESLHTVDDRTLVIDLKHPSLGFFDQPLSDVPVLPRHIWQGLSGDTLAPPGLPVGSGPYRLTGHIPGKSYTFTANRDYFRGQPLVRTIEVPVIRTAERTFAALRDRRVDMVPASLDDQAAGAVRGLGVRIAEGDSYLGTVLMFNLTRPPFDDPAARRTIASALDLDRITDAISGLGAGGGTSNVPAEDGYLHPSSPWSPDEKLHNLDEAGARVGFAELGLPPLRILAPKNDPVRTEIGRQVVGALQRAGAGAELVELPFRSLARSVGANGGSPNFQAAIWSAPPLASYDPSFLPAVFGNPFRSALNYSGYRSARFDELAAKVSDAPTVEARRSAVADELRLLARDLPVVPLVFPQGAFAYVSSVYDGWIYVKGSGILDKRSFLPDEARANPDEGPIGNPLDTSSDSGANLLMYVFFAGVVALVIFVIAYALRARRGP